MTHTVSVSIKGMATIRLMNEMAGRSPRVLGTKAMYMPTISRKKTMHNAVTRITLGCALSLLWQMAFNRKLPTTIAA